MMNLCTNAAHAMGAEGGDLKVTLTNVMLDAALVALHPDTNPGLHVMLRVSDTGAGIPPDIRDKIFDPYFTSKDKDHGTGLGLSVVHGIVKKCGGTITVETEVGKGSAFSIYLPVLKVEQLEKRDEGSEPVDLAGNDHILLIDDEKTIVQMGKKTLEQFGYQVDTKTSAREALALFRTQPGKFDMVLTDMAMPHMTGPILAKKLLNIRPDIPIVLCTGYSEFIDEEKAREIGIQAIVMKPFVRNELARTVRNVLDGKLGVAEP